MKRWGQLDGLRGIAVLVVFFCHAQYRLSSFPSLNWMAKGWVGVDLFFVLSGFLITGILTDVKGSRNYFQAFYARRALRIWPLYFLLLSLFFVLLPIVSNRFAVAASTAGSKWYYVFFVQNLFPHPRPTALAVTWSLAVEEQFYICWSLLVWFLEQRRLLRLMWVILVLAPVARVVVLHFGVSPEYVYNNLFHIDGLALGSVCALLSRKEQLGEKLGWLFALLGVGGVFLTGVPDHVWRIRNPLIFTFVSFTCSGALILGLQNKRFGAVLSNRTLIHFGKISYCLYLVHPIVLTTMSAIILAAPDHHIGREITDVVASLLVSTALSTLSLYLFENKVLALKRYFEYDKPVIVRPMAVVEPDVIISISRQSGESVLS